MYKKTRIYFFLFAVVILCLSQGCLAKSPPTAHPSSSEAGETIRSEPSNPPTNGISVGRPKVFDNRTLTIMLDDLSESLRNMQLIFVDQKSLAAALSLLQGSSSSESARNLQVTTPPTPGVTQDVKSTSNATATGTPLPDTTTKSTSTTSPNVTPQPPGLPAVSALTGFNPNYGESSSDLLSDQVNLTYQIFNLKMVLDRSLSDRLQSNEDPRLQAVLGFNVTIDPPQIAKDCVAVVEIELNSDVHTKDGLSLVSLIPQEKTYNAAAWSTKSNAFGATAVAKIIQVGYSQRGTSQNFYLYRDADTISYERMTSERFNNKIKFGWMFRPVLGRRSVSPGLRQLFAIVSLPKGDPKWQLKDEHLSQDQKDEKSSMVTAKVKTYWKKYDRNTGTSYKEDEANRSTRFLYGLSMGLAKPKIFYQRYVNERNYEQIQVRPTTIYQSALRPEVNDVSWVPVGSKSAVVSVKGKNFFSGMKVVMGDKTFTNPSDGLIIKSNNAFDISTTIDAIAAGPGSIIGRYGEAVRIAPEENPNDAAIPGIEIPGCKLEVSHSGYHCLWIQLRRKPIEEERDQTNPPSSTLNLDALPGGPFSEENGPIVTINGNVVPLPYTYIEGVAAENYKDVWLQCNIPDSFLSAGGGVVRVSWPSARKYTATKLIYDSANTYYAIRLDTRRVMIRTNEDYAFKKGEWNILGGNTSVSFKLVPKEEQGPLTIFSVTETDKVKMPGPYSLDVTWPEALPDKLILVSPVTYANENNTFSLDVPKAATAESPKPKAIKKPKDLEVNIEVNQGDSLWIDVPVKDVSKVDHVEANQQTLIFRESPPDQNKDKEKEKDGESAKTIQVQITRNLTDKPGDVDLTVLDKDKKPISQVRLHIVPLNNDKEKK